MFDLAVAYLKNFQYGSIPMPVAACGLILAALLLVGIVAALWRILRSPSWVYLLIRAATAVTCIVLACAVIFYPNQGRVLLHDTYPVLGMTALIGASLALFVSALRALSSFASIALWLAITLVIGKATLDESMFEGNFLQISEKKEIFINLLDEL